jgi:3-oxoacyl-[acyl-carrier-protein] synthase II
VLEEREVALARGATCYAEVRGAGWANDGRLLTPDPTGAGLDRAIRRALDDGRLAADGVQYVATHGCGTILGDRSEARALRSALGAAADGVLASTVKPQTGHLVAGAGALNVAVAALALTHGVAPATQHLDDPDPDCDLDWVPGTAREADLAGALALARGIAGQQVAVSLARAS